MEMLKMSMLLCLSLLTTDAKLADGGKELACNLAEEALQATDRIAFDAVELYALIIVESRWNSQAVSRANACGLTQVLPKYSGLSCDELMDPKTSVEASVDALEGWLVRARGNKRLALCGYSHGNSCFVPGGPSADHPGLKYADRVLSVSARIRGRYDAFEEALDRTLGVIGRTFAYLTGVASA